MSRSVWKGPFIDGYLIKKADKVNRSPRSLRPGRAGQQFHHNLGLTFGVHNGNKFIPVSVSEEMVGHKLGEFAPTHLAYYGHAADKKSKR